MADEPPSGEYKLKTEGEEARRRSARRSKASRLEMMYLLLMYESVTRPADSAGVFPPGVFAFSRSSISSAAVELRDLGEKDAEALMSCCSARRPPVTPEAGDTTAAQEFPRQFS